MDHATRQTIYKQIEAERGSKVLAFVTGERPGLETQIAPDAVGPFVSVLDNMGPTKKISLILDTLGGQTSAAWRLMNLIRSFGDEVEVIIPTKAMSSGTLMSLGADRIVMTKQAALGPIDPSLDNHPLAPEARLSSGQTIRFPVSAEAVRGYIDEVKKDVTDPAALASVWTNLAAQIHPLLLGQIFRLGGQIRLLATDLIRGQVTDEAKQKAIVNLLCSESGSHDYTINRRKAEEIGLCVDKPSTPFYELLTRITQSYNDQLETFVPLAVPIMVPGQPPVSFKFVRGLVESTAESYGYVTEGQYVMNPGPPPVVTSQRSVEGWRKLS